MKQVCHYISTFVLLTQMNSAWAVNSAVENASTTVFHTLKYKDVNGDDSVKCNKVPVKNKKGQVWGQLCAEDFNKCKKEGACLLQGENGNTLVNVTGSGASTFDKIDQSKCKFGTGSVLNSSRSCLIPFKSLACAPQVPIGTVIYIREAVGKHYTVDGGPVQTHDGNFICSDRGKDIVGGDCRVDVFSGYKAKNHAPSELELALEDKNYKNHCAKVTGGKLAEDDKLIKSLQELVLTSGDTPAAGAVADNSGGGRPAPAATGGSGSGAR